MQSLTMGQEQLTADNPSIPSSEVARKYGPTDTFIIEGRYYRMLRLSFDDFHATVDLIEEIVKAGSLPAAMAARVLPMAATADEINDLLAGLRVDAENNDEEFDPKRIDMAKVKETLEEKKRELFQTLLTPLFGAAKVRGLFNEWVANHLVSVSSKEEGAKTSQVRAEDLKNADLFPLDSFEEIADRIFNHPDLQRFFDKVSKNPKIRSMMSTSAATRSQSNGNQDGSQTRLSGDET